jgi:hypothetical protein
VSDASKTKGWSSCSIPFRRAVDQLRWRIEQARSSTLPRSVEWGAKATGDASLWSDHSASSGAMSAMLVTVNRPRAGRVAPADAPAGEPKDSSAPEGEAASRSSRHDGSFGHEREPVEHSGPDEPALQPASAESSEGGRVAPAAATAGEPKDSSAPEGEAASRSSCHDGSFGHEREPVEHSGAHEPAHRTRFRGIVRGRARRARRGHGWGAEGFVGSRR